jgi:hypothetical protein
MARGTLEYQIFSADVDSIAVATTDRLLKVIFAGRRSEVIATPRAMI